MSAEFKLSGYVTFSPIVASGGKTRVLVLVREDVATKSNARLRKDLMTESVPSVWIQQDARVQGRHHHSAFLLGGLYRQWSNGLEKGLQLETAQLQIISDQRPVL
jgi:hypothetical protein